MNKFQLFNGQEMATVVLEKNAISGMDYMTDIFCGDIEMVSEKQPTIVENIAEASEYAVLVATCGYSTLLDAMEEAKDINLSEIKGKREVYGFFFVESERTCGKKTLVIAGSDKRGTIYGMFRVSEEIGVSPWVFWADAIPEKRESVVLGSEVQQVSKEPSVRYRGFFINDEQPCFGNWAKEKYGSAKPCPELYRHIFELLLRLKGNYLWPAMWRSDFTMDDLENARLADKMGVIVGASHHEPCCRSGGEFQKLRRENPQYGEDWSMLSNADGVAEFWKDGLIRNSEFESLITIGMRGEFDSYLMPEDATLEDNINVLKSAITVQKELIEKYGNKDHPQLLAIYKEVEDYYQGDENTEGLKDWDVLQNDIMMLCDDNFGNVRTLPNEEERKRPGGYGMYYHFDYYGGPVSYLWINSTPLTKIWEQMCMTYDYGVQEAWIVNVGDIKNQELALSYFLDLAYDFEKWGTNAPNQTTQYTKEWCRKLGFRGNRFEGLEELVEEYVRWNGTCRPEVLKPTTYHPAHYNEAKTMLKRVEAVTEKVEALWTGMAENDPLADCFFETVYYPVMASANIIQMQIYAGFNQFYVKQRKKLGNKYSAFVEQCIKRDRELVDQYHTRNNGRWNHMQSVFHIGFIGWNDEEWQYPDCHIFHPVCAPRLLVNIAGEERCTGANPWRRKTLSMALCETLQEEKAFEIANSGIGTLKYHIVWDADWLTVEAAENVTVTKKENGEIVAETEDVASFVVRMNPAMCPDNAEAKICIYGDNCEETAERSENESSETRADIIVTGECFDVAKISGSTFVENCGIVTIEAPHYSKNVSAGDAEWKTMNKFGKTLGGVKVFPVTAQFAVEEEAPTVEYSLFVKEAGEYQMTLYTAPSNPVVYKGKMNIAMRVNDNAYQAVNTIPEEGYVPWLSHDWSVGVLDQIHKTNISVTLNAGENVVSFKAMDPAVVLEKVVLVREGVECPDSYLGPTESYCAE